jgi:hypothetical protein
MTQVDWISIHRAKTNDDRNQHGSAAHLLRYLAHGSYNSAVGAALLFTAERIEEGQSALVAQRGHGSLRRPSRTTNFLERSFLSIRQLMLIVDRNFDIELPVVTSSLLVHVQPTCEVNQLQRSAQWRRRKQQS